MGRRNNFQMSDFYCTSCGEKTMPVWRKSGQGREAGHLKRLYCLKCKREVNCIEIKPFSTAYTLNDFKLEYEYGNFDTEGNRVRSLKELKGLIKNGKIERQKTLDSVRDPWSWEEHLDS